MADDNNFYLIRLLLCSYILNCTAFYMIFVKFLEKHFLN